MNSIKNSNGRDIVLALIKTIQDNAQYLSDIDGAIGDGDHGVNMNKGFTQAEKALPEGAITLTSGLEILGDILLTEIGGSMGPLYGTFFLEMASACEDQPEIDAPIFKDMLGAALEAIQDIGDAKVGDKTLIDTLVPAYESLSASVDAGVPFAVALDTMIAAARQGQESTRNLVAKLGRASRLGERSRGHLDPGATSCYLLLSSMAESIRAQLNRKT